MRWHRAVPLVLVTLATLGGLLLVTPGEAQVGAPASADSPLPNRGIGLRGGFNLADLVGDDAGDSESAVGLSAGASFQILSFGPVSIGPEVYYAQKKSESRNLQSPTLPGTVASGFNLAYVEVPVLLKVRLPRFGGGRFIPHVHGGPVFGWNLDCDIDLVDQTADPEDTCASLLGGDAQSTLDDYEQGVTVGAGLDVVVLPGHGALTLDLRTTQGLSDVIQRESGQDLEIKNRTFSAMLGYAFAF